MFDACRLHGVTHDQVDVLTQAAGDVEVPPFFDWAQGTQQIQCSQFGNCRLPDEWKNFDLESA